MKRFFSHKPEFNDFCMTNISTLCLNMKLINKKRTYLFTSSADCAMKNPCVLATIFAPLGLMEIFVSTPSVPLTSMARSSSFSFVKHNLYYEKVNLEIISKYTGKVFLVS